MTPSDALTPQPTSPREIGELLARFELARSDALVAAQSVDGRYVDAYTAGFLLAKIIVRASGYRVRGGENHRDTLSVIPWLMGTRAQEVVDALESARKKRNADLYDGVELVDEEDVAALLRRIEGFEGMVREWLDETHPNLLG